MTDYKKKCEELTEVIEEFLDCPRWLEQATIPKAGIEANPEQVVFNMSCGYMKIKEAYEAIGKTLGIS